MGIPVLILGESGTGKSASLRSLEPDRYDLVNVAGKPLPFKGKCESINTDSYRKIKNFLKDSKNLITVIDDAQYLMANEFMRRATERGYDKFTEIAQNFWDLIQSIVTLPPEKIVYVLAHIERDQNGNEKIKTIGKMLDEKITVEGMFTIVLKTYVKDGKFGFLTQNSGHDTVKSPIGMFKTLEIDNDLKAVDLAIRDYYDFSTVFDPAKADGYAKEFSEYVDEYENPTQSQPAKNTDGDNTEAAASNSGEQPKRTRTRKKPDAGQTPKVEEQQKAEEAPTTQRKARKKRD